MIDRPSTTGSPPSPGRDMRLWRPLVPVVVILIVINCSVFAGAGFLSDYDYRHFIASFGLAPGNFTGRYAGGGDHVAVLISFISHSGIHSGIGHLLLNMVWLFLFAQPLAIRFGCAPGNRPATQLIGSLVFLSLYLSAAVFSGLAFVLANLGSDVILIGASGAASAVMAASVRVGLRRFQPGGIGRGRGLPVWDWKVLTVTIFFIAVNVGLATPWGGYLVFDGDPASVAWEAHVAGYLYGLLMFSYFDRLTGRR